MTGVTITAHDETDQPIATQIAAEQKAAAEADHRRREVLTDIEDRLAASGDAADPVEGARRRRLRARRRELIDAGEELVFGRLDTEAGDVLRIGRTGVPAAQEHADPLVLDWRAAAARPFYTATALHPEGLVRRRHIRMSGSQVIGVDDESLTTESAHQTSGLVGEGALLAALEQRRTGRMGTAVATLQREQDAIIRADHHTPLVVQGGPGTGKTVVALHRVAYLLFARPELAERGVLVIGPSRVFLDYIGQVLPALGQTEAVASTCTGLVDIEVTGFESRVVAEIKGRAAWADLVAEQVERTIPVPRPLTLTVDGEAYTLPAMRVAQALGSARSGGRTVHAARESFLGLAAVALADAVAARSHELLAEAETGFEDILARVDAAVEATLGARDGSTGAEVDGVMTAEEVQLLRDRFASEPALRDQLEEFWPVPTPAQVVAESVDAALSGAEAALSDTDRQALRGGHDRTRVTEADIPLLDAAAALLGQEAHGDSGRVFGHVVVDEAQELSPMQWRMLVRRCPTRSFTMVGDIDQATSPGEHTTWEQALGTGFGEGWARADLSICYRTPAEVMALTPPVLAAAGSENAPPRAVRSTGHGPVTASVDAGGDLAAAASTAVEQALHDYPSGTVGLLCPPARAAELAHLADGEGRVSVLGAVAAKGLEFDAVVLVDPEGIAAEPRGHNALYVALTRCTQALTLVRWAGQGS